jgi:hypothetical protein
MGARVAAGAVDLGRRAMGGSDAPQAPPPGEAPEKAPAASQTPATQAAPKPEITDTALARKVESEIFRGTPRGTKSKVSLNAVGRVVHLRGEAKTPDLINELESRAAAIPEVERVENLLHLPKTPSPTRSDTPSRQRKTKTTKGKPPAAQRRRVNSEKKSEGAEPGPKDLAKKGSGRQPAPLGSKGSPKKES